MKALLFPDFCFVASPFPKLRPNSLTRMWLAVCVIRALRPEVKKKPKRGYRGQSGPFSLSLSLSLSFFFFSLSLSIYTPPPLLTRAQRVNNELKSKSNKTQTWEDVLHVLLSGFMASGPRNLGIISPVI